MDNHGHTPSAPEPLTHANIGNFPDDTLMTEALASSKGDSFLTVDQSSSEQDNSDAHSVASNFSSTRSATSSVYDFVEEHGRTYHKYKEGKYVLPNDVEEQNRLDIQHQLALKLLEGKVTTSTCPRNRAECVGRYNWNRNMGYRIRAAIPPSQRHWDRSQSHSTRIRTRELPIRN